MNTLSPDAVRAETVTITGHGGDEIEAYLGQPLGRGLARRNRLDPPHARLRPGDQGVRPTARRRRAITRCARTCTRREAPGADPDDAAAAVRAAGGVPDERLVGDVAGAVGIPAARCRAPTGRSA